MSEVQIHLYSLVHREDLLDSSTDTDLQLYLPAAKLTGLVHYKSSLQFSSVFFNSSVKLISYQYN